MSGMEFNLTPLLPAAEVTLTALSVLLLDLLLEPDEKGSLAWISMAGVGIAGWLTFSLWGRSEAAFQETLILDNFGLFITFLLLGSAALTILSSIQYVKETRIK